MDLRPSLIKTLLGLFVIVFLSACELLTTDSSDSEDAPSKPGVDNTQISYNLGGQAIGLNGKVIIRNGEDFFVVEQNGSFILSNVLVSGDTFDLSVDQSPAGQECYLENKAGIVQKANISSLVIICIASSGEDVDKPPLLKPIAHAGSDKSIKVGQTINLDSQKSFDPQGKPIKRFWQLVRKPDSSIAVLNQEIGFEPSFVVDVEDEFIAQLIVENDETQSEPDFVRFSALNLPPVANAGIDQTIAVNATATLSGEGSTDVNGDRITYQWAINEKPQGSNAVLTKEDELETQFTPDVEGRYVFQLITTDDFGGESSADKVIIDTQDSIPVANAGKDQTAGLNMSVELDGSASFDVDAQALNYHWTLVSTPPNSNASLMDETLAKPSIEIDVEGEYFIQLRVSDQNNFSEPDIVKITSRNSIPEAILNASALSSFTGESILLDAYSSTDEDGDVLEYQWALLHVPPGSQSNLESYYTETTNLTPDRIGFYVVQLIVTDEYSQSEPVTLKIEAKDSPPVLSVEAIENSVLENNAQGSGFRISRAGSTAQALDVSVVFSGTATNGIDYQALPGSMIIPVAESFVDIFLFPMADFSVEGDESVIVNLAEGDGFTLGANSTANLTIIDVSPALSIILPIETIETQQAITGEVKISSPIPAGDYFLELIAADSSVLNISPVRADLMPGQESLEFDITGLLAGNSEISITLLHENQAEAIAAQSKTIQVIDPIRPTVTVAAMTDQILETDDGGVFRISREGSIVDPLDVSFTLEGEAINDVDYQSMSSPVTIPALESYVDVLISPMSDLEMESDEAVIITLSGGIDFDLGIASTATMMILDVAPTITMTLDSVYLAVDRLIYGSLSIETPISVQGLSVDLASSNPDVANVLPSSFDLANGQQTVEFELSGVSVGEATISAMLFEPGQQVRDSSTAIAVQSMTIYVTEQLILLDDISGIAPEQPLSFPVSLSHPAPAGGVTLKLSSADSEIATITESVNILEGDKTPDTDPVITGVALGQTNILVSAPGYAADYADVNVRINFSMNPPLVSAPVGVSNQLTISLAAPAPANGVLIQLESLDTAVASISTNSIIIPSGENSATFDVLGQQVGTTTIVATFGNTTAESNIEVTELLPVLTVSRSQAQVAETNGQGVYFRISRSGSTAETLVVDFELNGTASKGIDYQNVYPPVSLVSGQSFVDVFIIPIADLDVEQDETVTLTLINNAQIELGAESEASIVISDSVSHLSISLASLYIGINRSIKGILSISTPIPFAGLSVDLASSNPDVAKVSPPSFNLANGQQTVEFELSGVSVGEATISAMLFGPGEQVIAAQSTTISVTANLINLGRLENIAPEQQSSLAVSLTQAAPPGGVTLSFVSTNPDIATVTESVTIVAGNVVPASNPQVTGVGMGSTTIIVTAVGYGADERIANVGMTFSINPQTLSIPLGWTKTLTIDLDAAAPSGGLNIDLQSTESNILEVSPASVVIPQGQTSATFSIKGLAEGSAQAIATIGGDVDAISNITVTKKPVIFVPANKYLGINLQDAGLYQLSVRTDQALSLDVVIEDPSVARVSTDANTVGEGSLSIPTNANTVQVPRMYFQGLKKGTSQVTLSLPGYDDAIFTIIVERSTVLFNRDTINTTTFSSNSNISVLAYSLDENGVRRNPQAPRPGFTLQVPLTVADPTVGKLTNDKLIFNPTVASVSTEFDPMNPGQTTISLSQPAGFESQSSPEETIGVLVTAPSIGVSEKEYVGEHLQLQRRFTLSANTPSPREITVSIEDGSLARVSAKVDELGEKAITIPIAANRLFTPYFWFQGIKSGTTSVTLKIPGYNEAKFMLNVQKSTVTFGNASINTSTFSKNSTVVISTYALSDNGDRQFSQPPHPGSSLVVPISVANTDVGTVTSNTVAILSGAVNGTTEFDPMNPGQTTISLIQPPGFISENKPDESIVVNVTAPDILVGNGQNIGKDLQMRRQFSLSVATPEALTMTISIENEKIGLVSLDPNVVGGKSIEFPMANTSMTPAIIFQGLTPGSTMVTFSMPGYNEASFPLNVFESTVSFKITSMNTTTFSANTNFSVLTWALNSNGIRAQNQEVRAGVVLNIPLEIDNARIGRLIPSVLSINSGEKNGLAQFDLLTTGSATVRLIQPQGFSTAKTNPFNSFPVTVRVPKVQARASSVIVIKDDSEQARAFLEVATPQDTTATIEVAGSKVVQVASALDGNYSAKTAISVLKGNNSFYLYLRGITPGSTTVTIKVPGYNDAIWDIVVK